MSSHERARSGASQIWHGSVDQQRHKYLYRCCIQTDGLKLIASEEDNHTFVEDISEIVDMNISGIYVMQIGLLMCIKWRIKKYSASTTFLQK